jgi:hypothetical protein
MSEPIDHITGPPGSGSCDARAAACGTIGRRGLHFCPTTLLILIYFAAVVVYVHAAMRQLPALNVHPVAGGQGPYIDHAEGIARRGLTRYRDDRNRMPLVPWMASLVYDSNINRFAARAAWLALAISLGSLVIVAIAAHAALPRWPAAIVSLTAAFGLMPDKATFLGAEVPFYALFFASAVLLTRLLIRPTNRLAVLAGLVAALAYYTKASVLPLLGVYTLFAAYTVWRPVTPDGANGPEVHRTARRRALQSAALTLAVFAMAVMPYAAESYDRFGRVFFNVNSDIVMWCDSWPQALRQIEQIEAANWPERGWGDFPGPLHYLQNHSAAEIFGRLTTGLAALAGLAFGSLYGWVVAAAAVAAIGVCVRRPAEARAVWRGHRVAILFAAATLTGYLLLYGWYVKVAFGDRFVQSLVLPVVAGLLWVCIAVERRAMRPLPGGGWPRPASQRWGPAVVLGLALLGGWRTESRATKPDDTFVPFFFNECQEQLRAHRRDLAKSCFEAVLALDPAFGPAYLGLGTMDVYEYPATAEQHARRAAELMPASGEPWNLLGFLLDRQGRREEAWEAFRTATTREPGHRDAWLNYGSLSLMLGRRDDALGALATLEQLGGPQAKALRERIDWSESQGDAPADERE